MSSSHHRESEDNYLHFSQTQIELINSGINNLGFRFIQIKNGSGDSNDKEELSSKRDKCSEILKSLLNESKKKSSDVVNFEDGESQKIQKDFDDIKSCQVIVTNPLEYETEIKPDIYYDGKLIYDVAASANTDWQNQCLLILNTLEQNPIASTFSVPLKFDTEDLCDQIEALMDLQTVRHKLQESMYSHPFRWQHDVRTIFYVALKYNQKDSPIWKAAAESCVLFENLCKKIPEVNPYAVFIQGKLETEVKTTKKDVENGSSVISKGVKLVKSDLVKPEPAEALSYSNLCRKKFKPNTPKGVVVRENGNVIYTSECYNTNLGQYYIQNFPKSALPKPCLQPNITSESRFMNLGVSNAQKKNLPARFKELDVTYRFELLEWLKDELDIHPYLCAIDIRYIPDLDLIPTVKAKKFFSCMRALLLQQKETQETLLLPVTLPKVIFWDNLPLLQVSKVDSTVYEDNSNKIVSSYSESQVFNQAISNEYTHSDRNSNVYSRDKHDSGILNEVKSSHDNEYILDDDRSISSVSSISSSSLSSNQDLSNPDLKSDSAPYHNNLTGLTVVPGWGAGKQYFGLGLWRQAQKKPVDAKIESMNSFRQTSTCWGEWKVKALQADFKMKEKANELTRSEREAVAERANAEI